MYGAIYGMRGDMTDAGGAISIAPPAVNPPVTVGDALGPLRFAMNPVGALVDRIPLNIDTIPAPMLNENRTATDTAPAPATGTGTNEFAGNWNTPAPSSSAFNWRAHLPWLIALAIILVALYATRHKRSA